MSFRTKLDFSDNRQVKQHIETLTLLSGATSFGVTFSALPTGPDLSTTGITETISPIISSFSGNSGTTIYYWGDSRMSLGENTLSAITPSNSATTQTGGPTFTANTTTLIDGNQVALTYTGVSYDVSVTGMTDLGGGNYSGDISTSLFRILSADTIDFTGRTIWNDVSGITRTERLIITDNPMSGHVWTCIDSEGMGAWLPNSSADTNTYTTGATLISDIAYFDTNLALSAYTLNLSALSGSPSNWDSGSTGNYSVKQITDTTTDATANYSVATGRDNIASGIGSFIGGGYLCSATTVNSAVIGGDECIASGFDAFIGGGDNNKATATDSAVIGGSFNSATAINSVVIGGSGITGGTTNTVYVPNLNVRDELGIGIEPQYKFHAFNSDSHLIYDSSALGSVTNLLLSGNTNGLTQMAVNENGQSTSISIGVRGSGDTSYPGYGKVNDSFVYVGFQSNGLNFQTAANGGYPDKEHYFRFYAGQDADGTTPDVHIQGSGSTRGYVGIGLTGVTQQLDVANNARFRNIGSSASAGALHYTADGTLTTNTSDSRLKTNIQPVTNALDKILNLRGVYYNWTEDISGDTRLGFIAQEVNSVVPELAFTNERSQEKYMGVHYDNVTALLVEGFKELFSGQTTINNTHLETQTILAEDNNIDLNYNGTQESALGGGITVLHGRGDESSKLIIDENGDWTTNTDFKAKFLTIPLFTPVSSNDASGSNGNIARDNDYLYVKCDNKWKRTKLEEF
jgi:hypothetical protein